MLPVLRDVSLQHCKVMVFDSADLKGSVQDPALTQLLSVGWTLLTQFAADVGEGHAHQIVMILAPPRDDPHMVQLAEDCRLALVQLGDATTRATAGLDRALALRWWLAASYVVPVAVLALILWRSW